MKTQLHITNHRQNTKRARKITFIFTILLLVFINNVVGQKYSYYYTKDDFLWGTTVNTIDTADIDNNGQVEILLGADSKISIKGSVSFDKYNGVDGGNSAAFGDIDGDGDIDFVNANNNYTNSVPLSWYENSASNFTKHNFGSAVNCDAVCTANILNGSKDNIVIGIGSKISWLSINSDTNFTEHIITTNAVSYINTIKAADINGDGKVDIVSKQGTTVVWYQNNGSGGFSSAQTITNNLEEVTRKGFDLSDVDNDGDIDLLVNGNLRLFLNNGSGVFTANTIDNNTSKTISFGDINGDGLVDIVACYYVASTIPYHQGNFYYYWYKNTGNGNYNKELMFYYAILYGVISVIDFAGDNVGEVFIDNYKFTAHDCNVPPTGNIIGNPNPAPYTTLTYVVPNTVNSTYEWGVVGGAITTNNGNSIDVLWGADGAGSMYVQEKGEHDCNADTVWLSIYVDIDKISPESNISIYPNPTSGIIQILNAKNSNVEIVDITGKLIQKVVITNEQQIIDLSQEIEGVYFIKIITEDGILTKKLILN